MSDYQFQISIVGIGPRPPYRELVHHVYGPAADVDTDGNSHPPESLDWTWLYMSLRPPGDIPDVVVDMSDDRNDLMFVRSNDEQLAIRTASFLADRAGGVVLA